MQHTNQHNDLPAAVLHTSCKTLNIAEFKECYCNSNFTVLVIEGNPTAEQLAEAWENIIFEYGCLIKNENSEYLFDIQKRIAELTHHIAFVDAALDLLSRKYSQDAIDELIELGYDGIYNFDDHIQYVKQLNRVKSLCKTRVMDLLDLQEEYKKYQVSTDPGQQQSEDAFEEWMGDLSRFQHYPINQESTTVIQWAGIINAYIKHHKSKNPQPTDG